MSNEQPTETPVDLTIDQIKQREADAHRTVSGQNTPQKPDDEAYMRGNQQNTPRGTINEIPPGTTVGVNKDDDVLKSERGSTKSQDARPSRR